MENKITIDKFLETFDNRGIEIGDVKQSIKSIVAATGKIPVNGEYDSAIVGNRIGEYIYAIQECGKLLTSLGLIEKYQVTQVDRAFSKAALEKAPTLGYSTDGKSKLYAQSDDDYIKEKNKLSEIQAVIMYIENYQKSLNLAHLHCKKILERNKDELRFASDHEKYSMANWIDEEKLK